MILRLPISARNVPVARPGVRVQGMGKSLLKGARSIDDVSGIANTSNSLLRAQHRYAAQICPAAAGLSEGKLRSRYLHFPCFPHHLSRSFDEANQARCADRIRAGATARRIYGNIARHLGGATADEFRGFSGRAQAEALIVAELEAGIRLLHFDDAELARRTGDSRR